MEYFANNEAYLRATEFLKGQIIKKGYDWDTARMKPMDSELYVNKSIEVGGTVPLLTGASVQERGITNFDGNKLEKGRVFVANGVAFSFVVDDKTKLAHGVTYSSADLPPALAFANLVLKQKDEVIIKIPINALTRANGRANASDYRELGALALIEDNAIVEFDIEFPQGAEMTVATGKALFVSVSLRGFETYLKR